jgi:hypothetical protein
MKKKQNSPEAEKIFKWLQEHPHVSKRAICKQIGYSSHHLGSAMKKERGLPDKYIQPLIEELEKYGFVR